MNLKATKLFSICIIIVFAFAICFFGISVYKNIATGKKLAAETRISLKELRERLEELPKPRRISSKVQAPTMGEAKSVEPVETLVIEDGDVEVYKMVKTITLHYEDKVVSGIVSIVENKLSSNFTYVESTSNDTFEGNNNVVFNLNLNKDYFVDYALDNGILTGEIKKENAKQFFNVESLDCSSNPKIEIALQKNLLTSYNCSYLTTTEKEVSINVTYAY